MVFDVIKYVLIASGAILLGVSIILAMSQDKVLCCKSNSVSDGKNNQISNIMEMYPNLNAPRNWENNININKSWKMIE